MEPSEVTGVLNRLLQILCRSLPCYLDDAGPWTCHDDQRAQTALDNLVADQRMLAHHVAQEIVEQGGRPDTGGFPMNFTAINDVAMDYLVGELIEHGRRDVAAIKQCVADLKEMPTARLLAEEALGNAQGHLEIMEEVMKAE